MTTVINGDSGKLITPEPEEMERIRRIRDALADSGAGSARYMLADQARSEVLELPCSLFTVLAKAAEALAQGHSVSIVHYDQELTTQQAADLLGVSRPYLVRLLEEGKIRYHKVGTHRRILMGDLQSYKRIRDERRRADLSELIRVSETLGLYDDESPDEE